MTHPYHKVRDITPEITDLPENITLIFADTHKDAFAKMNSAVMQAPINTAIWYRNPANLSDLFREAHEFTSKSHAYGFMSGTTIDIYPDQDIAEQQNEFPPKFPYMKKEFIAFSNALKDTFPQQESSLGFFGNSQYRYLLHPNGELDLHIDENQNQASNMVQILIGPQTVVTDNKDMGFRPRPDGSWQWKNCGSMDTTAWLVPRGCPVLFAPQHHPHAPSVHGSGPTHKNGAPGPGQPRVTVISTIAPHRP